MKAIILTLTTGTVSGERFAKRMYSLLYKASDSAAGMGLLHEEVFPSEEKIWAAILEAHPIHPWSREWRESLFVVGDYILGRRIKWDCRPVANTVMFPNYGFIEGQSFSDVYPTVESLIHATAASLQLEEGSYTLTYKPKNSKRNVSPNKEFRNEVETTRQNLLKNPPHEIKPFLEKKKKSLGLPAFNLDSDHRS